MFFTRMSKSHIYSKQLINPASCACEMSLGCYCGEALSRSRELGLMKPPGFNSWLAMPCWAAPASPSCSPSSPVGCVAPRASENHPDNS